MTDRRFEAAIAAMQGLLQYKVAAAMQGEKPIGFAPPPAEVLMPMSVKYADALIAELDRTAPKCEHRYERHSQDFPVDSPIVHGEICTNGSIHRGRSRIYNWWRT